MTLTTRITSILSDRQGITAQAEAIQALVVEVAGEAYNEGYEDARYRIHNSKDSYLQTLTDKS